MENRSTIGRLCRTALLTLAVVGCGVARASGIAFYDSRIINAAAGFPGCGAGVCAESPDVFAPGAVQFNQQWNTGTDIYFMDGAAYTTGSMLTGPPSASARMRTNISGGADANLYYEFQLTCAEGMNCLFIIDPVPIHVVAFGSVDVRPDPTADDGAGLLGSAVLNITQAGQPALSGSVIAECLYRRGECDTSSVPHSFTLSGTIFDVLVFQTTSVSMSAFANVLPPLNGPGRGAGEVIATVDPVFYIDPEFRINGVLATDLLRLEFSPNVSQVPLPTTALLFPTAMAAALGWRRRKR
jgi:hypothetical protein